MSEAINSKEIIYELKVIKENLDFIKTHMVDIDSILTEEDYFYELEKYTHTQYQYYDNYPEPRPWIGQSANYEGKDANGMARWNLKNPNFYNHSGYCDLVISGLVGFRPQEDGSFSVNPLIPENKWDYFCLDGLKYRDKYITILYDKTGNKYNKGKGLQIYIDGLLKASAPQLQKLKVEL